MNINSMDILYFLLPGIIGYGSNALCNVGNNAGNIVKFRPPSFVFGIVWPVLFSLFGISWAIAMREAKYKYLCLLTYGLASISLGVWTYLYACKQKKKEASWVIIFTVASLLASFSQGNELSRAFLSPLISWILFALIMNTTEVQNLK